MRLSGPLLAVLLLGGCALVGRDGPRGCDGRATRPANPNGSILMAAAPQASPGEGSPRAARGCR